MIDLLLRSNAVFRALLILLLAVILFWLHMVFDDRESLFMNLTTEGIGIFATVALVDSIIKTNERRKALPAVYAAARELSLLSSKCLLLWHSILRQVIDPVNDRTLLLTPGLSQFDERLAALITRLDLDTEAPVNPQRDWAHFLVDLVHDQKNRLSNCLARYSAFLSPRAIRVLQELEECEFYSAIGIMPAVVSENRKLGLPGAGRYFRSAPRTAIGFISALDGLLKEIACMRSELDGQIDGRLKLGDFSDDFIRNYLINHQQQMVEPKTSQP